MASNHHRMSRIQRTGLSVLEFVGCLFALIGGAWLGAVYLGIDVHHVAYVALSESDLLEKVPENWRPEGPEAAAGAPNSGELAKSVQRELVSLREEITALRSVHESRNAPSTTTPEDVEKQAKEQTIDYWNRIHNIVREQAALELNAESAATAENAAQVATLKGRINRVTANALRAIPSERVDAAATALSRELADWYERSGDLYDQAVGIWDSKAGSPSSALTKDWEFAQLQLHNEGRLLGDKIAAVRDSLSRRFGEQFTEFAGP